MWHSFEKYSDLCDLFNEIFKTGNWGVTCGTITSVNICWGKDIKMTPFVHVFLWKSTGKEFAIIVVYVDDINIIGTPEELPKVIDCLKKKFEMKDLGKTKFCLGLQIEHLKGGILMHQEAYIAKVLKCFYMDKSHPLSTPMVVRSLDVEKDPFRPQEEGWRTTWSWSTKSQCNRRIDVSC